MGATNELWRFDPRTSTWTLLDTVPDKRLINVDDPSTFHLGRPQGRERHTSVVLVNNPGSFFEGRMIVFGGHGGGGETVKDGGHPTSPTEYLGDLWQMDPDGFSTAVVRGGGENKLIQDARNLFVSTNTTSSSAKSESESQEYSSRTDDNDVSIDPSLCLADVNVRLRIQHACTRDLRIELLGPGHGFRGAMHRESTSRHHGQGSDKQESSAAEDPPLSRDTPVLLFDGHDGSRSDECGVNIENVLFDDQADVSVDEDYLSPFKVGCCLFCLFCLFVLFVSSCRSVVCRVSDNSSFLFLFLLLFFFFFFSFSFILLSPHLSSSLLLFFTGHYHSSP